MKKLLITGFDPFGGESVNPAWEAVKLLPRQIGEYELRKLELPTVFGVAARTVLQAARQWEPDAILCVGQAGGRDAVTPERIGINIRTARIADNEGNAPQETPIIPGGPDGLFATVPVDAMARAICAAGLPGKISNTAGTFVCNDTLYTLLHHYRNTAVRVGFVHVPYLSGQGTPSMPLPQIAAALAAAIEAL